MRNEKRGGLAYQAKELLADLLDSRLEVVLIPSRDPECAMRGGMIRAVQERNAQWYREFCEQYPSHRRWQNRKGRTRIKRRDTIRGLNELIAGKCNSIYAQRLKEVIETVIANEAYEEQQRREATRKQAA